MDSCQQLKLYAMHQKLHAPIDNSYRAKSQSVRTLIQWHKDNPTVSRLVLSGQVLFPLLATLVMTLFFIYVIELEPRNMGRKLNNQVNSSVDYISASGEAKILIILTISVLFNFYTLITDALAFTKYHNLAQEVKKYYYKNLFEFRCFFIIPCLMTTSDILSLLFIIIPAVVVVGRYYKKYTCTKANGPARQDRARSTCTSKENLLKEENIEDGVGELGQSSEAQVADQGAASAIGDADSQARVETRSKRTTLSKNDINTTTTNVNWSIMLYSLLSPLSCIATHAYHIIIAFIDNAYHASSVLLLFIIVLFIHVVVFQKIYYYVCKWRNSKKHSNCCKNFCWTMLILFCFFLGVITLAVIIGLSVSILILIPIDNAFDNAPTNIYVIYQGSVAVIAALVTFQVFFRETNSVAEVFIKARDKMIQGRTNSKMQEENKQGTQPDSRDDKRWEKMSEKEKELHLATAFLEYVFRKTKRRDTQTSASQTDPLATDPVPPIPPTNGSPESVSPKNESHPEVTSVEVH